MKKLLRTKVIFALLVGLSFANNSFAQVGDGAIKAPTPSAIMRTLALVTQYQQAYLSDSKLQNKKLEIKYLSFSNKNNKYLNDDFTNINKVYFTSVLYYQNQGSHQATNISLFQDQNGITNGFFYSIDSEIFGMPVDARVVPSIDFVGLKRFLVGNITPSGDLTRVSVSRNSYNTADMVGFVYKDNNSSQCTEYMVGIDYKYLGMHSTGCFDI